MAWKFLQQAHTIDMSRLFLYAKNNYREDYQLKPLDLARKMVDNLNSETASVLDYVLKVFPTYSSYYPSVARYGTLGSSSVVPIFIVGFYRSGSTLLETLLSKHENIESIGEQSLFASELLISPDLNVVNLQRTADVLQNKAKIKYYADKVAESMRQQGILNRKRRIQLDVINRVSGNGTNANVNKKLSIKQHLDAEGDKVKFVIDKSLINHRNVGWIHLLFPKALIIHIYKKDYMNTLFSCYKQRFDAAALSTALHPESLVKKFVGYTRIMHHFNSIMPVGAIVNIEYESLVKDPEKVLRAIVVQRLRLPWDGTILQPSASSSPPSIVYTASMFQVKQTVHNNSLSSWKRYQNYVNLSSTGFGNKAISIASEIDKYVPIFQAMRVPAFLDDNAILEDEDEDDEDE